jgi:deoxyribodipyrimidine photo-lyase
MTTFLSTHSSMNDLSFEFPPTLEAAHARLAAINIGQYAKTRNAIGGAVSKLSPYVTHGFLSFPQIASAVQHQTGFSPQHKFVFELGWRAYFHHVWAHLGAGIFKSLHEGVLPDSAYQQGLPADITSGNTGIPAIDQAVQQLVQTGYLHNHARMWLASYVVHIRKVHWLVGANWMYGYLLDGDLASNMLSWQWVAGTGSSKPYLFNAENVAKYAPKAWHSEGTVLDTSYEQLAEIAHGTCAILPAINTLKQSALFGEVPALKSLPSGIPKSLSEARPELNATVLQGKAVLLIHPWSLGDLPRDLTADTLVLGVVDRAFHAEHPWSEQRWAWIMARMQALCHSIISPSSDALQTMLDKACSVQYAHSPHAAWLSKITHSKLTVTELPKLFTDVGTYCKSFSAWWNKAKMRPLSEITT